MKIFTESEATEGSGLIVSNGDLVRLNDGREVVKVKHSLDNHSEGCKRDTGECCAFVKDVRLCRDMWCTSSIYLEKPVYLQLKLVGEVE